MLDTNVIVAAMRSGRGAAAELLRRAISGTVTVVATVPLALEYEAVCTRAEHVEAAGLSRDAAKLFVQDVIGLAEPSGISYRWRPQLPDPADELVLEAAINGRAPMLVTFNVRHFREAAPLFGIQVCTPAQALELLR